MLLVGRGGSPVVSVETCFWMKGSPSLTQSLSKHEQSKRELSKHVLFEE
ncbi:hypothetical protein [Nitratireductor aestuarii]|jgi:hypothetical protein|nr:hypothetical protein [Nitratireductor aestuarii]